MSQIFRTPAVGRLIPLIICTLSLSSTTLLRGQPDYYFVDDTVTVNLVERNDTLYEKRCDTSFICGPEAEFAFRIVDRQDTLSMRIFGLQQLGFDGDDPYRILVFHEPSAEKTGLTFETTRYTADALQEALQHPETFVNKFMFTLYGREYLESLKPARSISHETVLEILTEVRSMSRESEYMQRYRATATGDGRGTQLAAEILNIEFVKRGYCPIGNESVFNSHFHK